MAVHVRVPVVAAVEGRVERMRRTRIGIAVQGMTDMIGILRVQALERETSEAHRRRRVERRRSIAVDAGRRDSGPTHGGKNRRKIARSAHDDPSLALWNDGGL